MRAPPLAPLAAAVLQVPPPERALVIGCGEGEPVFFLAREFPAARIRGVDRSAELIRAANARVGLDPEGRVALKVGGRGPLPYPDGFFGLVVQARGRPAVAEIARVMQRGGRLIVVRPAPTGFFARISDRLMQARLRRWRIAATGTNGEGEDFLIAEDMGPSA